MTKDWKAWVVLAARLVFAYLLISASIDKLQKPIDFALMVTAYRIPIFLSPEICRWVGIWLPYVEILVGVFLILGIWLDAAVIISAMLMTIFTLLVTQAFARGLDISCGCFAVAEDAPKIGILKVLENIGLTTGSMVMVWMVFKFQLFNALTLPIGRSKK